jgi:hypothetical protein
MLEKRERIRALNDELRRTFQGGRVLQTKGIQALGPELVTQVHEKVRTRSLHPGERPLRRARLRLLRASYQPWEVLTDAQLSAPPP